MYIKNKLARTTIRANESYEGETIEEKIERIVNNKEPIRDGAPIIYTDRKDGVMPEYDIRTDRFEIAIEAMDKVAKAKIAKREEFAKKLEKDNKEIESQQPSQQDANKNPGTGDNTSV